MRQEFWISTIPTGQARPRFYRRGNFVGTYDAKESRGYKLDIKYQVMDAHPVKMQGPLTMTVDFMMPRPKAHYGSKGLKKDAPHYHEKKPDIDNLIKALLDSVSGILFDNDSQISVLLATKKYSEVVGIKLYIQDAQ
jgi:Holliday junction resolvase RusA-like endonuclease